MTTELPEGKVFPSDRWAKLTLPHKVEYIYKIHHFRECQNMLFCLFFIISPRQMRSEPLRIETEYSINSAIPSLFAVLLICECTGIQFKTTLTKCCSPYECNLLRLEMIRKLCYSTSFSAMCCFLPME